MQPGIKRVLRYFLFFVVVAATICFLFLVREVLLSFVLGAILAYLLFRPVLYIEKKGLKRVWAILILYTMVLVVLVFLFYIALPGIAREIGEIADIIPEYAEEIQDMVAKVNNMKMPEQIGTLLQENISKIEDNIYGGLENFVGGFYIFLTRVLAIVFSPILAFYIMNDWEKIRDRFLTTLSPGARREIIAIFEQIDDVLIEFFKGHLMVAVFVGALVGLSAAVLGVHFPLVLGILSGVTNLIPYFGAFLGGIPAVVVALTQSFRLAVYISIAIIIIQQIEGNIIAPKIIGNKLGMHPLLIVFSLLAGGKLMGIWGMLLAVPTAAVLKVLVGWAYLKIVE